MKLALICGSEAKDLLYIWYKNKYQPIADMRISAKNRPFESL
jgi:hypothetical protein